MDPDPPSADIRIGYARCSPLGQERDFQLDALAGRGTPRGKIFSEKISTRVRVRPKFEEALRTARKTKAHAPHCRVIFTVYEMKRPRRRRTYRARRPPLAVPLPSGSTGLRTPRR
ncbi:recombinase family protein [Streptomyces sp. IBSNAI001]|uniref:recombinase family protein n=1 Tax=Streptomyces sp. IBSNAI001 TaxID=3457499 RepID=UPI003FD0B112